MKFYCTSILLCRKLIEFPIYNKAETKTNYPFNDHYLASKKSPALLRGITSKSNGDFYYLNCLHSFKTKTKLKCRKKVCKNKNFSRILSQLKKIY